MTGFVFDIPHIRGQELCEFGPVWHSVNDILKVILQSGLAMKAEKRSFQSVKIKFSGGKKDLSLVDDHWRKSFEDSLLRELANFRHKLREFSSQLEKEKEKKK